MSNFIKDLDERYKKERKKYKIKAEDREFVYNIPLKVKIYGYSNHNYIIRKGKLTRFLYIKNGCRAYFTDADILTMLLQIQNRETMDSFIENLKKAYHNNFEKYHIYIGRTTYELDGLAPIVDDQILTNPKDIDISFNELLVLINLILAKDQASNPLWPSRPDFLKHTISKYISLIKHYYYGDKNASQYLLNMGYNIEEDIYTNYNSSKKRDEKRGFFSKFDIFEKSGVL